MKNDDLRDRMLELEPYPEDLKMKIREEIKHTKERPLARWERVVMIAGGVALFLTALKGIYTVATCEKISEIPTHSLATFGAALVGALGVIVWLPGLLKRGTWNIRNGFYITIAGITFLFFLALKEIYFEGSLGGMGMFATLIGVVAAIATRMEFVELRLRERVLRNELALAELAEQFGSCNERDDK
jgi:hypothetical protein